jgi:hypothetical protein
MPYLGKAKGRPFTSPKAAATQDDGRNYRVKFTGRIPPHEVADSMAEWSFRGFAPGLEHVNQLPLEFGRCERMIERPQCLHNVGR